MAKKKQTSRTDAVRQAVDQAFQSQIPRERISELLDELGSTAGRLRGAVDDLRPASTEEVKSLRSDLQALVARVDALEAAAKAKPKPAPRRTAAKRATAAKPAARAKPAAKTTAAAKPAAAKTTAAAKPAASATAAAKPAAKPRARAAAKPKPAGEAS